MRALHLCFVVAVGLRLAQAATSRSAEWGGDTTGVARTVCCGHDSQLLVCKEMVRYLFLTTGYLPELEKMYESAEGIGDLAYDDNTLARQSPIPVKCQQDAVVLMQKHHEHIKLLQEGVGDDIHGLHPQEYHTRLTSWQASQHGNILIVAGGDHEGMKHGTFDVLEKYGIAFRIEGDIIPDMTSWSYKPQPLLNVKVTGIPTFDIRGLQPFHDFPEGPDWWDRNQYKAIFTQLSKMKMNFLGLHTYPYSPTPGTGRDEPTVWVGLKEDVTSTGAVMHSYPTSYANTMRNQWGDSALPTGQYHYGAKDIFSDDCYGSEVQVGNCPLPTTMAGNNEVFARTGDMLKTSFQHAHSVDVQTCVGTEVPLSKPGPSSGVVPLNLYYSAKRHDHFLTTTECAECENLYTLVGIEGFISITPQTGLVPISTYFNGKLLDNVLSTKPVAGYSFVRTEGYVNASQWSDANSAMDSLQIFFNAKIVDHLVAANPVTKQYALANGYVLQSTVAMVISNSSYKPPTVQDYYEGIFTRIMNLGLPIDYYWMWTPEGWEWGKMTENNTVFQQAVSDLNAALAAREAVNAPFKLATCGWVVGPLPDRSIFDKVLPSEYAAITSIDMQVGNTPVDKAYLNITQHKKWAIPWMEDDPGLTAPELWVNRTLEHMEDAAKYGCNGLLGIHWRTKATSPQIAAMGMKSWNPSLTSMDFWTQWSKMEFGITDPAAIFISIDSFNLPRPVGWIGGPGGWSANMKQCSQDSAYAFVDKLAAMKPSVKGASNNDRFDYWLSSFEYMRNIARTECAWAKYNAAAAAAAKITDATKRAEYAKSYVVPARVLLLTNVSQVMNYLLQTVISPGEMGTVMNVLSHSLVHAVDEQTAALEAMLKPLMPLPASCQPSDAYAGPNRVIVPTVRSTLTGGENLTVVAILLLNGSPGGACSVTLKWKTASATSYTGSAMTNVARQVYRGQVALPKLATGAPYMYFVLADCPLVHESLTWPSGAPTEAVQSLVID